MTKQWLIYDADGNYVNGTVGTEEWVRVYCEERGYTYELDPNWVAPLTDYQKNLIKEHNWVENRLTGLIEDHSWAHSREEFDIVVRQYDAMVEYYMVLRERIMNEGLEDRLNENDNNDLSGGLGGF